MILPEYKRRNKTICNSISTIACHVRVGGKTEVSDELDLPILKNRESRWRKMKEVIVWEKFFKKYLWDHAKDQSGVRLE